RENRIRQKREGGKKEARSQKTGVRRKANASRDWLLLYGTTGSVTVLLETPPDSRTSGRWPESPAGTTKFTW
ncbi:MAG: hypothetical protein HW398_1122, partial [Acidobacteria bacterium]|nr:hypothetical protein [Acidobacteriota bacterium]